MGYGGNSTNIKSSLEWFINVWQKLCVFLIKKHICKTLNSIHRIKYSLLLISELKFSNKINNSHNILITIYLMKTEIK